MLFGQFLAKFQGYFFKNHLIFRISKFLEPFKLGIIENLYAVRFGSVWSGSVR